MAKSKTAQPSAEVREEISQAVAEYLRDTDVDKQSLKGFAAHLTKKG